LRWQKLDHILATITPHNGLGAERVHAEILRTIRRIGGHPHPAQELSKAPDVRTGTTGSLYLSHQLRGRSGVVTVLRAWIAIQPWDQSHSQVGRPDSQMSRNWRKYLARERTENGLF
jgi:hypothetical protein